MCCCCCCCCCCCQDLVSLIRSSVTTISETNTYDSSSITLSPPSTYYVRRLPGYRLVFTSSQERERGERVSPTYVRSRIPRTHTLDTTRMSNKLDVVVGQFKTIKYAKTNCVLLHPMDFQLLTGIEYDKVRGREGVCVTKRGEPSFLPSFRHVPGTFRRTEREREREREEDVR